LVGEDGSVINKDNTPVLTWATGKIWVNNHAHVLSEKGDVAVLRFLYHYLATIDVSPIVRGVPPKINQQNLRDIVVPLPPLVEQRRIVAILDKFDALTTDLASGLPAEIEGRRRQYEYYRDLLLTFKERVA
jgi:type I restriction enzyme S subunit